MIIIVAVLIFAHSKNLNVLSLGKDVATSFGVKYQPSVIYTLVLVAILMSISTALIGPLTFYGFLVATLSYQAASTYDHRYIFPMAFAIGFLIMTSAYFLMYHVFHAQGVVSVIIELFGGIIFLTIVLRKRAL
ncbi:ferrichromeABC transporter permease [Streptococcus pneumoniae]|nr:ferrichromeABC transporter permease [Streptococcus pneumoniae]